jgi:hypothetical protein
MYATLVIFKQFPNRQKNSPNLVTLFRGKTRDANEYAAT